MPEKAENIHTESSIRTPFLYYRQCINFFLDKNPARQRFVDILDQDSGASNIYATQFSGDHPHDLHAEITKSIQKVFRHYTDAQYKAFVLCELERCHYVEAAKWLGFNRKTIARWLRKIREDLEREFIRRELIPDDTIRES